MRNGEVWGKKGASCLCSATKHSSHFLLWTRNGCGHTRKRGRGGKARSRWQMRWICLLLASYKPAELVSFLLAKVSLPVAPWCFSIPQILPPLAWSSVSCKCHSQAGRAVLQGSLALEEEEKWDTKQGFCCPCFLNTALQNQWTEKEGLTFDLWWGGQICVLNQSFQELVCCPLPGFMAAR